MQRLVIPTLVLLVGLALGVILQQPPGSDGDGPGSGNDATSLTAPSSGTPNGDRSETAVGTGSSSPELRAAVDQLTAKLAAETTARQQLERELAALQRKVDDLTQTAAAASPDAMGEFAQTHAAAEAQTSAAQASSTVQTLVGLGVASSTASEIKRRLDRADLERLELTNKATREGWLNDERFREEMRKVNDGATDIRAEYGEDTYDRLLYALGQPNRVKVSDVMDGSAAALADIRANDLVLSYDGARMYSWDELRNATMNGQPGQMVNVTVQRGSELVELLVPRGPLGVRLDFERVAPQ